MAPRTLPCFIVLSLLTVLFPFTAVAAEAPSDDLLKMIVKLIGNSDKEFRAAGLDQIRTSAKGTEATKLFAAQLAKLDASAQIALMSALADRGDKAALPAILELFKSSQDQAVRAGAVSAIGYLGSAAELPLLISELAGPSAEKEAAKQSLIQLSDPTVSKRLGAEVSKAEAGEKRAMIDVLAARRAMDELPVIVAAAVDENAKVRGSAMAALGHIGRPEQLAAMLQGVLKAEKGTERDLAERNVALVCGRIDNEDDRASKLIEAMNNVPAAERDELLSLVGRVGGKRLVNFVADIASGTDPARRLLGIEALGKWPDASAADNLLEIATKTTDPAERRAAFQAYIKISASRDNRSDKQRLDRMKEAMKIAQNPEEQSLVINRTRTAYDVDAMRFVLPYVDQPQFAQVACETIVEIAHHKEVRDPNKAEFDKALDKVIETAKDPVVIDRAERYKKGQTWERPRR